MLPALVEAEALATIASTKSGVSINFLVEEMHWFEMSTTGVSETKWFGVM